MNINNYFENIDFKCNIIEIYNNFATNEANVHVSYWGGRVITLNGYEGSLSLDSFTKRLLRAAKERCYSDDLTPMERAMGMNLSQNLKNFYSSTNSLDENASCITRILYFIRELPIFARTRYKIEDDLLHQYFAGYSEDNYSTTFSVRQDETGSYTGSEGYFGNPLRIIAPMQNILNLIIL